MANARADERFLSRLSSICGLVFDQPELLAEISRDWSPAGAKRELFEDQLPIAAVMPETVDEIVALLALATEFEREIIVRGGGTGLSGSIQPIPGALVLDLRALNAIDPVNEIDGTIRVEAGVFGGELNERLDELGFRLGHVPRSLNLSTVGGWIATNAAGALATGIGGIDALVAGVEAVLADGTIVRDVVRPRRGPDLAWKDLLLGSETRHGIVTAATLRVRPLADARRLLAFTFPALGAAIEVVRGLVQRDVPLTAIRIGEGSNQSAELFALIEGVEGIVEVSSGLLRAAVEARGGSEINGARALDWDAERTSFAWIADGNEFEGDIADEIDVSATWSNLERMIDAGLAAIASTGATVQASIEHAYPLGASVIFRCSIHTPNDLAAIVLHEEVVAALMEAVIAAGATATHHSPLRVTRRNWANDDPPLARLVRTAREVR
jgi:alkyldihydroxyacetonephosphate synthase